MSVYFLQYKDNVEIFKKNNTRLTRFIGTTKKRL
jgi:hypothetical protein